MNINTRELSTRLFGAKPGVQYGGFGKKKSEHENAGKSKKSRKYPNAKILPGSSEDLLKQIGKSARQTNFKK
ncbi:MAG: hypothetical protein OEZ13_10790 [Spirochaetia bacterium]|nr:hypothetical protein [Spirochaetia bacterium]